MAERVKLTDARAAILRKLLNGEWQLWSNFTSAGALPSLRRSVFQRGVGRTIPWNGSGQPMLDAGWIERETRPGWAILVRITPAGRQALEKRDLQR